MKTRKVAAKQAENILVTSSATTRAGGRPKSIPVEVLSSNVNIFLGQVGGILGNAPQDVGTFSLREISLSVEITAKGELSILGTGGGIEAKGGITFVFKKGAD